MSEITAAAPGTVRLMMGNDAIARGALEAGVGVAAAYPGTPSSEIITSLAESARERGIYVQWSANEKVALEVAAGASMGGVRAITAMKQLGVNVALDFLANVNLTGINAGLVFVAADDPGALSSTNEQDSRNIAKILDLPLLEPATPQEAKEMVKFAFDLSEQIKNVVMLRSVTRISHSRGNVVQGDLPEVKFKAAFDTKREAYTTVGPGGGAPRYHKVLHEQLVKVAETFNSSPFNWYTGPAKPELLIVTCGSGWLYSQEAVNLLGLKARVGILKLGTTWPLPKEVVSKNLARTDKILVIEEVDAFLENNLKEFTIDNLPGRVLKFYGKGSHVTNPFGENNPDVVIKALSDVLGIKYLSRADDYREKAAAALKKYAPPRDVQFCAGCPHRALFWSVKEALRKDGRGGFVTGDIGCYGSGVGPTGFSLLKTMQSMGSGIGVANGLGKLGQFGFTQPVLTMVGDSTFFHAAMPALVNAVNNQSDFTLLVLDNSGTAMTGFQPHPGMPINAMGEPAPAVSIDELCRGIGVPVEVVDSYDIKGTTKKLQEILKAGKGPRVVIARRECALIRARKGKAAYKVRIEADKCTGCKICSSVFKCPGLKFNKKTKKAELDLALCDNCGVCVEICPKSAIVREAN